MATDVDRVLRSVRFPDDDCASDAEFERSWAAQGGADSSIRLAELIERMSLPCSAAGLDRIAQRMAELLVAESFADVDRFEVARVR